MQHPELPLFAFLSATLVLIPSLWHWRSRNVAVLAIIFWLSLANLINGVNTIVWAGNAKNPLPVWCDITTKFLVGASYALPLATLCICKHLEMVSSSRKVSYDAKDRRRRMIFESIMCFGLPMIFMALHYIVQGHRYDIFETTGCTAAVYISIQAILIIWFPQLLFSVITLIYATLALHNFVRRRLTFAAHLQKSNSALTTNRYLRLIAMSLTTMVWTTTLTTYNLYNNIRGGLRPWISWANVHSNFSRVGVFPTLEIPPQFIRAMMLFWWSLPASSLIFFIFFGFGEEAIKEYRKVWRRLQALVLRRPLKEKKMEIPAYPNNRQAVKPLHLISLKTMSTTNSTLASPNSDYPFKSAQTLASEPQSHSSVTLTASSGSYVEDKSGKALEAQDDFEHHYPREPAPQYVFTAPPIGISIDSERSFPHRTHILDELPRSPTLPGSGTSSAFPGYGIESATASPTSPAFSTFAPEPPTPIVLHSLPPPPRRGPRQAGSNSSFRSMQTAVQSNVMNNTAHPEFSRDPVVVMISTEETQSRV